MADPDATTASAPVSPESVEPVVFERATPRWAVPAIIASFVASTAVALLALTLVVGEVVVTPAAGLGVPEDVVTVVAGVAAVLVMLTGMIGPFVVLRTRYGRCEVAGRTATFWLAVGSSRLREVCVPLTELEVRRLTPRGVRLFAPSRGRLSALLHPLLIPTRDEAEATRAVALIADGQRGVGEPVRTFGRNRLAPGIPVVAGIALLLTVPIAIAFARGSVGLVMIAFVGFLAAIAALMPLVAIGEQRWMWPVKVTRDALIVARGRVWLTDLRWIAPVGRSLAFDDGSREAVAFVGADLPELLAMLRERIARAGGRAEVLERAPPTAMAAQRRPIIIWVALSGGLFLLTLGLSLSTPSLHEDIYVYDDELNSMRLVRRQGDGAPRLLVLQERDSIAGGFFVGNRVVVPGLITYRAGAEDSEVRLDLLAGRGVDPEGEFAVPRETTLYHRSATGGRVLSSAPLPQTLRLSVTATGRAGAGATPWAVQVDSVPALLEPMLPATTDPALRDYITGRRSRRCYEVTDAQGWRLLWGCDHGRTVFVAAVPVGRELDIRVGPCRHQVGGAMPPIKLGAAPEDRFCIVRRGGAVTRVARPLPAFDDLLAATAAVRAGASVAEALAEALPELADAVAEGASD